MSHYGLQAGCVVDYINCRIRKLEEAMDSVRAHSVSLASSFTSWFPHRLWILAGFHSPLISRLFLIPVFMNVSEVHSVMENVDGWLTPLSSHRRESPHTETHYLDRCIHFLAQAF